MTDVVEQVEEVLETVAPDEILDAVERVARTYSGREMGIVVGVSVGLIALSGAVGYRFAEKKLRTQFDELLEVESEKLREHYMHRSKARAEKPSIDDLAELAELRKLQDEQKEIVKAEGYSPEPVDADSLIERARESAAGAARKQYAIQQANVAAGDEVPVVEVAAPVTNVFTERDRELDEWDFAVEMKKRDPREPYIIHVSEFEENANEYDKRVLTWYEGDEVLTDEDDNVISVVEETVGYDHMSRFGHGSGDPNVVFIRNDPSEYLYEVARSNGTYAQEVHGMDPEPHLKHSEQRRMSRMRFNDE